MAALTVFAECAVVHILVASLTFLGSAGEFKGSVALFAGHTCMLPLQRKAGLLVFEFEIEPQR